MKTFVIAECGINHNGDIKIVKKMIDGATEAGADAVKFQKRTIETVYTKEELDKDRDSPWGKTNRKQKQGLELGKKEYDQIDKHCKGKIYWFASAWDIESQKFLRQYKLKYNKVASAMLTNHPLLEEIAKEKKHTFISTGMSTIQEIGKAVAIFRKQKCPFELMHCNSTYPMCDENANLKTIETLRKKFRCNVGYSGHEIGLITSCAAAVLGATSIERHITLNRGMYGSDQGASVEIAGFKKLVSYIRVIEKVMGDGKKKVWDTEKPIKEKLRWHERC